MGYSLSSLLEFLLDKRSRTFDDLTNSHINCINHSGTLYGNMCIHTSYVYIRRKDKTIYIRIQITSYLHFDQ